MKNKLLIKFMIQNNILPKKSTKRKKKIVKKKRE